MMRDCKPPVETSNKQRFASISRQKLYLHTLENVVGVLLAVIITIRHYHDDHQCTYIYCHNYVYKQLYIQSPGAS